MVDRVFGDYFVKCKVIPEPEKPAEAEAEAVAAVEDEHKEVEQHQFYERASVEDVLVRTNTQYVAVLFTAEHCPPCHAFM